MLPYPTQSISGVDILSNLAAINQHKGNLAVLVGSSEQLESLTENFTHNPEPINFATQTQSILRINTEELLDSLGLDSLRSKSYLLDPLLLSQQHATLTDQSLLISLDPYTGKKLPKIMVAVLPIQHSWLAPCYLRFETFHMKGVLAGVEHSALMKRWCDGFQAQVIALTHNSIELVVKDPPRTEAETVQLAKEFAVYCPDLIDHGAHPIDALACQLYQAHHWYFSWF